MVLAHNINNGQRTQDIKISEDVTFDSMLLSPTTLQGLRDSGFYKPSPIQFNGIPFGKCGFDLLLEAKSGTGKTAVFSIIVLEKLDLRKGLQAVVLAPTREIAAQICEVMKQIGSAYEGLQVEVVMGGMPINEDICKFKKQVHIVVGSPGRLKHLIQDGHINTQAVRILVLDEADKLMEQSFQVDIQYIYHALPKDKQVIMSSATYPESSKSFINQFIQGAQTICPDSNCILLGVQHKVTFVKYNSNVVRQTQNRFKELLRILTKKEFKQCLIFCNYQARVTELYKLLTHGKWPAELLYGQQDQTDRLDALKTLQEYKCRILVSTDLAARGIDASNVDLVINFEPPFEWQTYLHRIGRAGRYGSYGTAITILSDGNETQKFKEVVSIIKDYLPIKYLWSDEDFSADNSNKIPSNQTADDLQHSATAITDNYKKLWNIFTSKDVKASEQMSNFQNLCNSFQESKTESFSQLMNSFKNSPQDNDITSTSYRHIEIKSLQPNKDITSIGVAKTSYMFKDKVHSHIVKDVKEQEPSLSMVCPELYIVDYLDKHRKKNVESESLNLSTKSDSEASLLADQQPYFENKIETEVNRREKRNNNDPHEHFNKYNVISNEILEQSYEDTEASRSARLQTSFSSSKYNKYEILVELEEQNHEDTEAALLPTTYGSSKYNKENKIQDELVKQNYEKTEVTSFPTTFGSSKYNKYNETQDEHLEQSYEDTEAALLNAGLPTSFSSSKYKNYNLKRNISRNNVNKKIKDIKHKKQIDSVCSDNYNRYYNEDDLDSGSKCSSQYENPKPSKKNNTTYRNNYFAPGSSKDCKNNHTTTSKNKKQSKYDQDTDVRWRDSDSESNSSNSSCLSKDYINWYTQLKARMRQIEYIFYVNELSKM